MKTIQQVGGGGKKKGTSETDVREKQGTGHGQKPDGILHKKKSFLKKPQLQGGDYKMGVRKGNGGEGGNEGTYRTFVA